MGTMFKGKNFKPTCFLDIGADKKEGGSKRRISHEAIQADRNWEGIRDMIVKKLGTFSLISLSLQEKVPK